MILKEGYATILSHDKTLQFARSPNSGPANENIAINIVSHKQRKSC